MKFAFKTAYERELALLKERAAQFVDDYPGLADRLGGLLEENLDPSIQGLLEGSAFLAARVQLNIDQQFRTFSNELLEQICPDATAPLPSAMLVRAQLQGGRPEDLATGHRLQAGEYLEASFSHAQRRVSCRFRLAEPIDLWPVEISQAAFHASPAVLSSMLGEQVPTKGGDQRRAAAGLSLTLARTDGEALETLPIDRLPVHFLGTASEAMALYEVFVTGVIRATLCWQNDFGDPVYRTLAPSELVEQLGFDQNCPLYERDERLFPGFASLLEYFSFPRKFLGVRLKGLKQALQGIKTSSAQIIFELDRGSSRLESHFGRESLGLFCAPAVNLFEDDAKPIALDQKSHAYLIAPNRTPNSNYEVQRILSITEQNEGQKERRQVQPLYSLPVGGQDTRQISYYTFERRRRRLTRQERSIGGTRFRYEGTETWLTIYEPEVATSGHQLFVRTLCSNRHLPEILPLRESTFHMLEDRNVMFDVVAGPTDPREAVAELETEAPQRTRAGDNYWRLLSLLSISYRGFVGADGRGNVEALREVLRLFSNVSEQLTESQINGISSLEASPVTRTVKRFGGYLPTRGLEIRVCFDEKVFDSGAITLLSAVLDRFLADYAGVNTFTQCVACDQKGKVMTRWPPRGGSGPLL